MDFEARLENFYRQLPLKGATVVDVGAHTGRHTIPLAHQVGIEGIIHAFEPVPISRLHFTQNLHDASANNVIVYPFALGSKENLVKFHYIPSLPEESGIKARHFYNESNATPELIDIFVRRLDDILPATGIDFLKIDIEGGELDMLTGADRILRSSLPIVAFECGASSFLGYHDRPGEIFGIFHRLGYSIYSILGQRITDESAFKEASHTQDFWDYVAIPHEKRTCSKYLRKIPKV